MKILDLISHKVGALKHNLTNFQEVVFPQRYRIVREEAWLFTLVAEHMDRRYYQERLQDLDWAAKDAGTEPLSECLNTRIQISAFFLFVLDTYIIIVI